jgi:cytochrome c2
MVDEEGETIFTDCRRCHVILAQGEDAIELKANFKDGQAFVHPEDGDTLEDFTLCTDCHTGGADVYE